MGEKIRVNYAVYQITNIINGKIYVGAHQTDNIDDGYMGSSQVLRNAFKKYGIENFTKEILHLLTTEKEMLGKEAEIVNEDFVKRTDTYNIKEGGIGRWNHINDIPKEKRPNFIKIKKLKEQGLVHWGGIQNRSEEGWKKVREQYWGEPGKLGAFNYEQMSDEAKKARNCKISHAMTGKGNSQYGTTFYIDPNEKVLPINVTGHRFKIGEQPVDWITFDEWRHARRDKTNSAYGKHWYTNGETDFLLKKDDVQIKINNLKRGRII